MVTTPFHKRVGSLISQTLNVVFLNGHPDESISARAYRQGAIEGKHNWERVRKTLDFLFLPLERNHCRTAFMTDYLHALELVDYRQVTVSAG